MKRSVSRHQAALILAIATISTPAVVSAANAACAVAVGSGVAMNPNRATGMARQDALSKLANSTQGAQVTNMDFGDPACLYLDDGSNAVKCTIPLSFCTQPAFGEPGQPGLTGPGHSKPNNNHSNGGGQGMGNSRSCATFNTQATANSLNTARTLVTRAMSKALRQRYGFGLNDPRVSGAEPACYYKDDGTNAAVCKMKVKVCR